MDPSCHYCISAGKDSLGCEEKYASKARPVVIVQSDLADEYDSVIVTLFTSLCNSMSRLCQTFDVDAGTFEQKVEVGLV